MPEKLLRISYLEHTTNDRVRSKINFLVGPQEPLPSRDGNLHGSGMSHATTASPKPSLGHLGGWATEEMLNGEHQRVDIPAHARTAHKDLLQKRLEEDISCIVRHAHPPPTPTPTPYPTPDDPFSQENELN